MTQDWGGTELINNAINNRIGVFICSCNGAIETTLDLKSLEEETRAMTGVAIVVRRNFLCHVEALQDIQQTIEKERLDRIVIAACSPLLYLKDFENAAAKAGLSPYMVEMSNIREQCAWMHSSSIKDVTRKARDQILMAISKLGAAKNISEGTKVKVLEDRCSGCGVCQATCRVSAIKMLEASNRPGHRIASVNTSICEGCGACVAACPSAAMDQNRFSNAEMTAMIDVITPPVSEEVENFPNILVFACHWCSYKAADLAGIKRLQLKPYFKVIRTMCSARVDPEWVMRALSRGADGVLILAGKPGRCHYEVGSVRTNRRMALLTSVIKQLGFDEGRFQTLYVDSDEPELFQKNVEEFISKIMEIGPNPMRNPEPKAPVTVPLQFGTISEDQMRARGLL
ncbi:MAG: hydrogenase iron-sulfur subunit [Methanomassiliicoccales archaeon]